MAFITQKLGFIILSTLQQFEGYGLQYSVEHWRTGCYNPNILPLMGVCMTPSSKGGGEGEKGGGDGEMGEGASSPPSSFLNIGSS